MANVHRGEIEHTVESTGETFLLRFSHNAKAEFEQVTKKPWDRVIAEVAEAIRSPEGAALYLSDVRAILWAAIRQGARDQEKRPGAKVQRALTLEDVGDLFLEELGATAATALAWRVVLAAEAALSKRHARGQAAQEVRDPNA